MLELQSIKINIYLYVLTYTTTYLKQKSAERAKTQPIKQSSSFSIGDNHSHFGEIEKKVTEDTTGMSTKTNASRSSTSSLTYSGARKTHLSVLPSNLKFYGTTEYKDQYSNKGLVTDVYKKPVDNLISLSMDDHSGVEKKLTTKKLKEQSLTEHRSSYIWPSNYLYNQHHVRPPNIVHDNECLAGDLITPSRSLSINRPQSGVEEMKTLDIPSKSIEGTKKSFMETDSIGSNIREISTCTSKHSREDSSSHHSDIAEKWIPTKNLHSNSPIQTLGIIFDCFM